MRGPIPKSAEVRILEGERAHRPLPPPGRRAPAGVLERPKGMTAAARRVWDQIIDQVAPLGYLRLADTIALRELCEDVAYFQDLQVAKRQHVADLERPERERRKKLRAVQDELRRLADQPEAAEQVAKLKHEEAALLAAKPEASALMTFAMTSEGQRVSRELNGVASRIMRREMQFGLTPVSSQRLGESGGGGMMPAAAQQVQSIEQALCG